MNLSLSLRLALELRLRLALKLRLGLALILCLRLTLVLHLRQDSLLALGAYLRRALRGHPDRKRRRSVLWAFTRRRAEHILERRESLFRGTADAPGMLVPRRIG